MTAPLKQAARTLAGRLRERDVRIVFAESCTAGLVAATLAETPGISEWLCGSAVVYQIETKAVWLGVPRDLLAKPGPVSRVVAEAMAAGALDRTPHADVAVSVTGHLGPNAPPRQDGLIYAAAAVREPGGIRRVAAIRHLLRDDVPPRGGTLRVRRQRAATAFVLDLATRILTR